MCDYHYIISAVPLHCNAWKNAVGQYVGASQNSAAMALSVDTPTYATAFRLGTFAAHYV